MIKRVAKMFSFNVSLLLIIFLQIVIQLFAASYWDWDTIKPEYWTPGIRKDENITERLIVADIIPNIIPVAFEKFCHIAFPIRWHTEWLYIHHQLIYDFEDVEKEPEVKWPCNNDKLYTLIFTNLDDMNGTHTFVHQFHWWLVSNIVNCSIFRKNDEFGYFSPTKDPVEGVYRQLLLIYEHQDPIKVVIDRATYVLNKTAPRHNFTIQEFADFNKFSAPVAGNFFKLGKPFKLGMDTQIDFDWNYKRISNRELFPERKLQKAKYLRARGKSIPEIAKILKVSESTVRRRLKKVDWIQCLRCSMWWHEKCTDYESGEYVCDFCS